MRARLASFCVCLAFALTPIAGCDKSDGGGAKSGESESTAKDEGTPSGSASENAFPAGSPEQGFLDVLSELTPILASDDNDTAVADAFEAHYGEHKARITAAAKALQAKKLGLDAAAQATLEDSLSATDAATAFVDAMEAFQSRATADAYERVEDVMLEVYDAAEAVSPDAP